MKDLYKAEYVGRIDIEDLDPVGYKVSFVMDREEKPLVIIADLPDEKFLPFIREELRSRKLNRTGFYKALLTTPDCYDGKGINRQNGRNYRGTGL